ncbi:uncharacterized protein TNCV_3919401 [Trichonephila clavipes]|nr:uncharacterized protein TNCV_3919401 [Trichonephila clavipes]
MVNTRLVYVLEKEKCISPLQNGFRKGRSTLDNESSSYSKSWISKLQNTSICSESSALFQLPEVRTLSNCLQRTQLTCSRCATVGHPSTDCTLEPRCVNCSQSHPSDSKLCSKWKTEKEIQVIKTNRNIPYVEARKLIAPQLSQSYAQVTKLSTTTTTTQTDESITKIVCPPLKLLQPLVSVPKPTISSSVAQVNKSSTSTQAELVASTSSVTVASPSKSQPPNSVIDTAPTTSNSLSISAASSSSTACSVLETTTTISNTIPECKSNLKVP